MKNSIRTMLSTAVLALVACSPLIYGKLESRSVAITQSNISVPGYGGGPVSIPANLFSFPFEVGDVTVDESSKDSSLKLNGAMVEITGTSAATFQGVDEFQISLTPPGGAPQIVARYKKGQIGTLSTNGKTITLVPVGDIELLGFLSNKSLTVGMSGSGTPPAVAWVGAVTLDFHVIAQKNIL